LKSQHNLGNTTTPQADRHKEREGESSSGTTNKEKHAPLQTAFRKYFCCGDYNLLGVENVIDLSSFQL
jgi:hypothetical protein